MSPNNSTFAQPTIAGPVAATRAPRVPLPAGSCDCHAHLFGPQSKYAYSPKRRYTPPDASLDDYIRMLTTLGVERGVLVQPSVYMQDNAVILDALQEARFPLRAVAVVNETVTDAELKRMNELGVRGLRLNLRNDNGSTVESVPKLAARIAKYGWHMQFRIKSADFVAMKPLMQSLPVDIVIDHIGGVPVEEGTDGAAFQTILELAQTGRCWVKLSAPMRMSAGEYPYADVMPFVHALVAAVPDRMVWATDWPHTTLTKKMPNDGDLADLLPQWIPDAATRKRILADNPARLYGV
jgi:predicted TIM-barrel fold metal-dependent hydrolase